jgi:hypothetical protein
VRQKASTQLTLFWKFVFPALYGVPFAIATVELASRTDWHAVLFAIPVLGMIAACIWFCPRYMIVDFDDEFLYVSNGSREIHIPWSQVVRIHLIFGSRWPTYALSFRSATEFGSKIFFSTPFGHSDTIFKKMQERIKVDA